MGCASVFMYVSSKPFTALFVLVIKAKDHFWSSAPLKFCIWLIPLVRRAAHNIEHIILSLTTQRPTRSRKTN